MESCADAGPAGTPAKPKHKWIRWTRAMREAFLDHLAATCNVKQSARAAGVSHAAVYRLRRRDPGFAAAWGEALALGYQMLETQAVGHVLAGQGAGPIDLGPGEEAIEIDLVAAMKLLTTHRNATGKPHRGGVGRKFADPDDTDRVLLGKLRQIERRAAAEAREQESTE